ncbi:hypothetical protein HY407_02540 [Candidatus Gottesmanbacteria bacterium]|nr:hypothetical protein [Candidatus Gottesmanbacteria bacterium]
MKVTTKFPPDDSIFRDRDKEAKFWEEHFDEAWKKGKPVKVKFAKKLKRIYLSDSINIRLDPEVLDRVRGEAHKRGLGPTQLIRMWIMEKVGRNNTRQARA